MTLHKTDVLLIGGGIMSKTLAMLVTQLDPSRHITLVEQASKLPQRVQMPGTMQALGTRATANSITPRSRVMVRLRLKGR